MSMTPDLNHLILCIRSTEARHYYSSKIPNELDALLTQVVQAYYAATSEDREEIVRMFRDESWGSWSCSNKLFAYAHRMATLAVREENPEHVFNGLLALVIEDYYSDWRDDLVTMSLLHHSAKKLNTNPRELFERAADVASVNTAKHIIRFGRSPSSIGVMGYEEVFSEDGFRYERRTDGGSGCLAGLLFALFRS
jgi:hypothetical protein